MKKNTIKTNIGTINFDNIEFIEISESFTLLFIPVIDVSKNMQSTIDKCMEEAKKECRQELLDRGINMEWSNTGMVVYHQGINVKIENKNFKYQFSMGFADKIGSDLESSFDIDVDLSEYEAEIRKMIIEAMIDKIF